MSDSHLPPPENGPGTGPPGGGYPQGPPGPGGFGGPPPPGYQGWPQQAPGPQFAQPAAQPFVGGYHGPDWVPELGVQIASAGARIGAKAIDIVIYILIQVVMGLIALAVVVSSAGFNDQFESTSSFNTVSIDDNLGWSLLFTAVLLVVDFLYNVVMVAKFGGQPGKLMVGLRVIRTDGGPMDFRTSFMRWLPILLLTVLSLIPIGSIVAGLARFGLLIASLVMVLSDPRRRSVFDRVASTYVITNR